MKTSVLIPRVLLEFRFSHYAFLFDDFPFDMLGGLVFGLASFSLDLGNFPTGHPNWIGTVFVPQRFTVDLNLLGIDVHRPVLIRSLSLAASKNGVSFTCSKIARIPIVV